MLKKSFRVGGPVRVGWTCKVDGDCVSRLSGFDVRVEFFYFFIFIFYIHLYPLRQGSCRIIHCGSYLEAIVENAMHWPEGLGGPNMD